MTRKEYVVQCTQQLAENTKVCLSGHGINGSIMKMIEGRPDVLGKLSTFNFSTVNAKKGGKGLKKAPNFKITAYKTFGEFTDNAAADVELFMSGLSKEDSSSFTNTDNISVIIIQADSATGNTEADIANLKSEVVPFDTYVKKAYKFPGVYLTLMYGDSIIAPRDAAKSETKAVVNKKIVARKNPAKVKALLAAKTKAKLASIKEDQKKLGFAARKTEAELQEFNAIKGEFGVNENARQSTVLKSINSYDKTIKAYINGLSRSDRKYFKLAFDARATNDIKGMYRALTMVSPEASEKVKNIIVNGNLTTGTAVLDARAKQFKLKIAEITKKNEELLSLAEAAPNAKTRGNINFKIRANIEQIKLLKAKIAIHGELNPGFVKSKATLLKSVNAKIEENRLKGLSLQDSLKSAIAQLPVTPQQKMQVQQAVVQQLATGTSLQLAVQQAIQKQQIPQAVGVVEDFDEFADLPPVDVFGNVDEETADIASAIASSKTVDDILAML